MLDISVLADAPALGGRGSTGNRAHWKLVVILRTYLTARQFMKTDVYDSVTVSLLANTLNTYFDLFP